jgi:phosphoserine/homoserine phosphotransferase
MLTQAEVGILFKAPQNVITEFPQFPSVSSYDDLKRQFIKGSVRSLTL